MDTMLLLVLLAYASGNPEAKDALRSFLSFYRENREVFAMLTQNEVPMPENTSTESSDSKEKNRPHTEAGNLKIIEDYLNKLG